MTACPSTWGRGGPEPGRQSGRIHRPVVLGPHIWQVSKVYDPEGVLSTLPAVATHAPRGAGRPLDARGRTGRRVAVGLVVGGLAATVAAGSGDSGFRSTSRSGPARYALFMAGSPRSALAACYWTIEGAAGDAPRDRSCAGRHRAAALLPVEPHGASAPVDAGRSRPHPPARVALRPPLRAWLSFNASLAYGLAYVLLCGASCGPSTGAASACACDSSPRAAHEGAVAEPEAPRAVRPHLRVVRCRPAAPRDGRGRHRGAPRSRSGRRAGRPGRSDGRCRRADAELARAAGQAAERPAAAAACASGPTPSTGSSARRAPRAGRRPRRSPR